MTSSVPWERARSLAHQVAAPKPPQLLELSAAIGCVLADDLLAGSDLPPADTSAMDGWAVNGSPPWSVVGWALAGRGCDRPRLIRGQAVVIATGAALPAGTTGIVRSEHGRFDGDELWLASGSAATPDLADVRRQGHEAARGELLVRRGTVVRPTTAGLAAAAGYDLLPVRPRPRVSLLVLGDELLDAGPPREGSVRDALGVQLPAWVQALGGEPGRSERVADDPTATLTAIRNTSDTSDTSDTSGTGSAVDDVLITTGGSAGGAADHLRGTLRRLDARIVVDTVDVRPGHPMLLAELPDGRLLVGLPGNPLAALAGVLTLLAPLLAGLSGAPMPPLWAVPVDDDVPIRAGRRSRGGLLIPILRTASGGVRPTGHSASAMLRGVALADGFLLVPPDGLRAGDPGTVVWFPWTPAGGLPIPDAGVVDPADAPATLSTGILRPAEMN